MLYDAKRWDRQITTHPLLLELIAWLETQAPGAPYWYPKPGECVWGRFLAARGREPVSHLDRDLFPGADWIAYGGVPPCNGEWTYGAALERAQALAQGEL
jgi:hypothetical protein